MSLNNQISYFHDKISLLLNYDKNPSVDLSTNSINSKEFHNIFCKKFPEVVSGAKNQEPINFDQSFSLRFETNFSTKIDFDNIVIILNVQFRVGICNRGGWKTVSTNFQDDYTQRTRFDRIGSLFQFAASEDGDKLKNLTMNSPYEENHTRTRRTWFPRAL